MTTPAKPNWRMAIEVDERDLAAAIEAALKNEGGERLGIFDPQYRLAAHAFLNYIEAASRINAEPDDAEAAGHLLFALCGFKPSRDEDAGKLFSKLGYPLRRLGDIGAQAGFSYLDAQVDKQLKATVQ